jgi:hypothetical protein
MKLDSKQMHIASQLFMAAGKAGQAFDLARFTREPVYASELLAQLAVSADAAGNDTLQVLVQNMRETLSSVTVPAAQAPTQTTMPATEAMPAKKPAVSDQYIGRLR